MKLSLIATVFNEQETIIKFLESVFAQTKLPEEIVIVDGGSTDNTLSEISKFKFPQRKINPNIKILFKKGNRSIGRNEAIKNAKGDIILSSDAGCVLEKNWVKEILKPFENKNVDVVAGYYKGAAKNSFQKSLIPYVLVMKDKIDKKEFLPATRSMAFKKSIWEKAGGFDEKLSYNEDYAFANKLKEINAKIVFEKNAVANWIPRKNLKEAFVMFFRFALGDAQANIFREKVIFIFLRYILAIYLILLSFIMQSVLLNAVIVICFLSYIIWSVWKNYRYVGNLRAIFYLPLLQFTSDFAVIIGTTLGFVRSLSLKSFFQVIFNNKGVTAVVIVYVLSMLSVISYGIPNASHPFNYFMDEWHQSQSVRDLFKYGTPNLPGAANGSIFQFFLTGIYLIPFQIFGVIDLFAIKSSVINLDLQFRLFEILRLNTILFGILSVILVAYIAKKYFRVNSFVAAFIFVVNPIWLMLSNYYKYDIALIFWILLSFLFFLKYAEKPNFINFLFGGIFSALAMSVKLLSPLPLLMVYILTFFIFTPNYLKKLNYLIIGVSVYILVYLFFGNPDILLGKGNVFEYIYSNVIQAPMRVSNFVFGMNYWEYYLTKLYPAIFGHPFYISFLLSFCYGMLVLINRRIFKKTKETIYAYKYQILLFLVFITFSLSLYLIKTEATNNRVLVLLPFIVLSVTLLINDIYSRIKNNLLRLVFILIVFSALLFQTIETISWFPIKLSPGPRLEASNWMIKHIPKGTLMGIENIPIYQFLPDIVEKEFYLKQYNEKANYYYQYQVVGANSTTFPKTIIVTNDNIESSFLKQSKKKNLLNKLSKLGYKKIIVFVPDLRFYKIFNSELEYFMSGLVQAPNTISIYEKL